MSIHKFGQNDVFVNTIKTKPHSKFTIYNGDVTYRADFTPSVPEGSSALYDLGTNILEIDCPPIGSLDFTEICNSQYIPVAE